MPCSILRISDKRYFEPFLRVRLGFKNRNGIELTPKDEVVLRTFSNFENRDSVKNQWVHSIS